MSLPLEEYSQNFWTSGMAYLSYPRTLKLIDFMMGCWELSRTNWHMKPRLTHGSQHQYDGTGIGDLAIDSSSDSLIIVVN